GLEESQRGTTRPAGTFVELVEDLAYQLLEQVLEGDDAQRPPEFVQDHGEMAPLPLHVEQQVAAVPTRWRVGHRADREPVSRLQLEEVKGVQHPDDFIQ